MNYTLPTLKYSYNDLEPVFTSEMLELHHTKHHANYINKLNDLLKQLNYEGPDNIDDFISEMDYNKILEEYRLAVKFNAGGHANHSFFWNILCKNNGNPKSISEELKSAIIKNFQTVELFKNSFIQSSMSHLGSGWAWLCIDSENFDRLFITTTLNHDNPRMIDFKGSKNFGIPILTLDLWEHSFYLKYKSNKLEYFESFWQIIDWDFVLQNYRNAVLGNNFK